MKRVLMLAGITLSAYSDGSAQPKLVNAFPHLTFARPVDLQNAGDGSDRLFVVEQEGTIRVFQNSPAATQSVLFLDIRDSVHYENGTELGLLGLAFHPQYSSNGFFYVNYTATNPLRSVIARFTVSSDPDSADRSSEQLLLEVPQPFKNHNGGQLAFGPDGFLYIALGDGGSGGDPQNNAQSITTLLGKILRIDVDGADGGLPYDIPPDNPFAENQAGGEIFAYGLRNPWRFSFDPATDRLWCADVGQNQREEINIIENGGNYGWSIMEGSTCYNTENCDQTGLTLPVWEYPRSVGGSITGGFVYRGPGVPQWTGLYIFGDFVSGVIAALSYDGANADVTYLDTLAGYTLSAFGLDEAGELYACALGGTIYRFSSTVTSVTGAAMPDGFTLHLNYPNPFNSSTRITFSLPTPGRTVLTVFDAKGSQVAGLTEGYLPAGVHSVLWNAANLPSGAYFSRLELHGERTILHTHPMLLLR